MIKMADFFKSKRRVVFIIGLLCITIMGGVLLISCKTKDEAALKDKVATTNDDKSSTNSLNFKILVFPKKYVPAMSISPGIELQVEFEGSAETVHYYTSKGSLNTWDRNTGDVKSFGGKVTVPYGIHAYWSPLTDKNSEKDVEKSTVKIEVYNKEKKLIGEREVSIIRLQDGFYSVTPAEGIIFKEQISNPRTIDDAVHEAILGRGKSYKLGETATEGHVILESEEKDGIIYEKDCLNSSSL